MAYGPAIGASWRAGSADEEFPKSQSAKSEGGLPRNLGLISMSSKGTLIVWMRSTPLL